ncbi:hypothetical protein D7Y23_27625 [Corallococcus sp. AB050B]|nr:hypothetical protein D7Y23_27625 [Corallococcus sp. AB050B]
MAGWRWCIRISPRSVEPASSLEDSRGQPGTHTRGEGPVGWASMKRLFLLLPLVALAGCKDPQDGVKVVISYGQFVPGCVRVTATDDASGDTRTTDVAVRGKKPEPNSQIVVGVLLPEKWGTAITVEANGYEALPKDDACVGNAVTNQRKGLSVPKGSTKDGKPAELTLLADARDEDGDGYVSDDFGGSDCEDAAGVGAGINPGAAELCNDRDDNCDGNKDEDFAIGSACVSPEGCASVRTCNTSDPTTFACIAPVVTYAWVDMDRDQHGDMTKEKVPVCGTTLPPDRLSLSFPNDDCDDTEASVHPGAVEICNNRDDNCVGGKDEGFNVGSTCTDPLYQCANSAVQCNFADGGTLCQPPTTVPTWYPDEDGDKYGKADAGVLFCPQPDGGYVDAGGDCNDGNRFTYANATELCDEQDNNCNGVDDINDNACPGGSPTWAPTPVNVPNGFPTIPDGGVPDWRAVSLYGNGGAWVVGSQSARAVKVPGTPSFEPIPEACTGQQGSSRELYSVWAMPNGTAYVGGDFSVLSVQMPGSLDCNYKRFFNNEDSHITTGFFNLATDGSVRLAAVASRNNGANGATFEWNGTLPQPPVISETAQPDIALSAVHGVLPDVIFAVGGAGNDAARILRRTATDATWTTMATPSGAKTLFAVHVANPKLAYAVGKNGTLLQWNGPGTSWIAHPSPPGVTENFTGVLSFGANSIYITTEAGNIYRFNGTLPWAKTAIGASLYGITGTSPGDIWVVGRFNTILHYPVLPQ